MISPSSRSMGIGPVAGMTLNARPLRGDYRRRQGMVSTEHLGFAHCASVAPSFVEPPAKIDVPMLRHTGHSHFNLLIYLDRMMRHVTTIWWHACCVRTLPAPNRRKTG